MTNGCADSLEKLQAVMRLCDSLDVRTRPAALGTIVVVPLLSWYDVSLDMVPVAAELGGGGGARSCSVEGAAVAAGPSQWPWSDFFRCKWPPGWSDDDGTGPDGASSKAAALFFVATNEPHVAAAARWLGAKRGRSFASFSHFLPRRVLLSDWLDTASKTWHSDWLLKNQKERAVQFSKAAGTVGVETQIRRLADVCAPCGDGSLRGVHCFGHSHRPKDLVIDGVRYVHNPMGYPPERDAPGAAADPRETKPKIPTPLFTLVDRADHGAATTAVISPPREVRRYCTGE